MTLYVGELKSVPVRYGLPPPLGRAAVFRGQVRCHHVVAPCPHCAAYRTLYVPVVAALLVCYLALATASWAIIWGVNLVLLVHVVFHCRVEGASLAVASPSLQRIWRVPSGRSPT
jgi:hypothetical protein